MQPTKPELLIDLLCQHPYYDNHPRPTKEEFQQLRVLCGKPSMEEMHKAISNLIARSLEFPHPPTNTLRIMGFKKGICDIGPPKPEKQDKESLGYWGVEWQECWNWFQGLAPQEQQPIRERCVAWLNFHGFWKYLEKPFDTRSPGRAVLMHERKKILDPVYGDFCGRYLQILKIARETRDYTQFKGRTNR